MIAIPAHFSLWILAIGAGALGLWYYESRKASAVFKQAGIAGAAGDPAARVSVGGGVQTVWLGLPQSAPSNALNGRPALILSAAPNAVPMPSTKALGAQYFAMPTVPGS